MFDGLKTYIGIGLTVVGTVAQAAGWDWWGDLAPHITTTVNAVVGLVGAILAFYGRKVAKPK